LLQNNFFNNFFKLKQIYFKKKIYKKNFFFITVFSFYSTNFIKKYFFFFKSLFKFKNYILVLNSNNAIKLFFLKISNLVYEFLKLKYNFYIFSDLRFLESFWKINLKSVYKKYKNKKKIFISITNYFFFKNKIKLLFYINKLSISFLKLMGAFSLKSVGIFNKNLKNFYFDYFFFLPNLDYIREYYINFYFFEIYLNFIKNKYSKILNVFYENMEKKLLISNLSKHTY